MGTGPAVALVPPPAPRGRRRGRRRLRARGELRPALPTAPAAELAAVVAQGAPGMPRLEPPLALGAPHCGPLLQPRGVVEVRAAKLAARRPRHGWEIGLVLIFLDFSFVFCGKGVFGSWFKNKKGQISFRPILDPRSRLMRQPNAEPNCFVFFFFVQKNLDNFLGVSGCRHCRSRRKLSSIANRPSRPRFRPRYV
jgi:hypothetical protein